MDKRGTRSNYDRLSRWYDLLAESSERLLRDRAVSMLSLQPGEAALDVGCGTGRAMKRLAIQVGGDGLALGLDLSRGMLNRARRNLSAAGTGVGRAALLQGDARRLPFQRGSLEAVLMTFSLERFDEDDIPRVLAEVRRVLKPGGRLCILSMAVPDQPGFLSRLYSWAHQKAPQWVDCRPIRAEEFAARQSFGIISRFQAAVWGLPVEILLLSNG